MRQLQIGLVYGETKMGWEFAEAKLNIADDDCNDLQKSFRHFNFDFTEVITVFRHIN